MSTKLNKHRMLALKRRLQTAVVFFLSSLPISNYADNVQWFPAIGPRLAPTGMTGDYLTGEGDLLLPTYGSDTGFLFTNFDGKYGNSGDTSYLSAGLGYRGIFADRIAGAYVFGDYNNSPYNNKFWVINPGIESLGRVVDFRANGYIPLEFEQNIGGPAFAEAMGNYTYTTFQGHNQYDALLQSYESIGYGGDAEIGSKLPYLSSIRAYVGGYYFDQKEAESIKGVSGRLEYAVTSHATVLAANTYDNVQHNVFEIGLCISIDGTTQEDDELYRRLLTPVVRHLANIKDGNGVPISLKAKQVGTGLVQSNIYFFSPSGDPSLLAQCTFEHPCNGNDFAAWLNANAPTIPTGSNFYFANGTIYPALNAAGVAALTIPDSFSVWGRTFDFRAPQSVPFQGAFILGNGTALHNLAVFNNPTLAFANGILISNSRNVLLDTVQVGTSGGAGNGTDYGIGVDVTNSSTAQINNSNINGFSTIANPNGLLANLNSIVNIYNSVISCVGAGPLGILISNNASVNVYNSSVFSIATLNSSINQAIRSLGGHVFVSSSLLVANSGNTTSGPFAVSGLNASIINIIHSTLISSGGLNNSGTTGGAFNDATSQLSIDSSVIGVTSSMNGAGSVYGVQGGGGIINVNNTYINVVRNSNGVNNANTMGILQQNGTLNVNHSNISVSVTAQPGSTANVFGIRSNNTTTTVNDTGISAQAMNGNANSNSFAYGIQAFNGGNLLVSSSRISAFAYATVASGAAGIDTSGVRFNATDGTATSSTITNNLISTQALFPVSTSNLAYGIWDNVTNPAVISSTTIAVDGGTGSCKHIIQSGASRICLDPL